MIPSGSLCTVFEEFPKRCGNHSADCTRNREPCWVIPVKSAVVDSARSSRMERHFCLKFTVCIRSHFWNCKSCLKIKTFKRSSVSVWYSDPAEWGSEIEKTMELDLGLLSWFTVSSAYAWTSYMASSRPMFQFSVGSSGLTYECSLSGPIWAVLTKIWCLSSLLWSWACISAEPVNPCGRHPGVAALSVLKSP